MTINELTLEEVIRIQDILDWAQNNNDEVLYPQVYINSRNNSLTFGEFNHYISIIIDLSPKVITKPHPHVPTYRKTAYLEKYLAKGGYRAEYKKAQEKLEEEKRRKDIELEGITTTIETSKRAIDLAQESNDIATTNKKYAIWAFWLAVAAFVISVLTFIFKK